jgi:hypothetical protein
LITSTASRVVCTPVQVAFIAANAGTATGLDGASGLGVGVGDGVGVGVGLASSDGVGVDAGLPPQPEIANRTETASTPSLTWS